MKQHCFPNNLFDKNRIQINEDDVITKDDINYFRIYWNNTQSQVEAISPTYGYLHNLTPQDISFFKRIGTFEEVEHLMIVD